MDVTAEEEAFRMALTGGAATLRVRYDGAMTGCGRAEILDDRLQPVATADLGRVAATVCGVAEGTRIATERGEVRVEELLPGDLVATREAGLRHLRALRTFDLGWRELGLLPILRPVRIRAGALGAEGPMRDLVLAGGLELHLTGGERRVSARSLVGQHGIAEAVVTTQRYFRLVLSKPGAVLANGAWVEGASSAGPDGPSADPVEVSARSVAPAN